MNHSGRPSLIVIGLSLLLGCSQAPTPAVVPAPSAPPALPPALPPITPTPGIGSALGLVEIRFEGIGTDGMTASARPAGTHANALGLKAVGGVQLDLASRGSFTTGTRGSGGYRHLYATFRVRNADAAGTASTQARLNLTFVAASTPSTVGETPLSSFLKFDGTAADAAIAATILPTHGMQPNPLTGGARLMPGGEDLQLFTEQEVDPTRFTTPTTAAALGVTRLFPYGFVVRNVTNPGSRTLPASPAASQFDGLVTFAVKVPLQGSAAEDPFSFSMMFEAVDDTVTRVSESAEEQALGSQATARATTLGATEVAALCGTSISSPLLKFIPSVTTAGNSARLARLGGNFIITDYAAPVTTAVGNTSVTVPGPLPRVQVVPTQGQPAPTLTASTPGTSTRGGNVTVNPDGSLTFDPKAGDGNVTDTISSSVSDGSCSTPAGQLTNTVNIGQRVWYVNNTNAAPTPDGRRSSPFSTLTAAQNASSAGDILYVYRGNGTATGQNAGVTLKANQKLIGQGVALTVNGIAIENAGQPPVIGHTTGAAVTLPGSGVTEVSGLDVVASGVGAQGITGTNFGTLNVSSLSVAATGGPALNLATGTVNGTVSSLSSTTSATTGLNFTGVGGTLSATGGSISGSAGTAVNVSGGALNFTFGGSASKASAGALLSVTGGHSGALGLNGSLSASGGTGLQFDDADGIYTVPNATLSGGDAAVDILNGSTGTFTFGSSATPANFSVTNPTGAAFTVNGSAANVTMHGNLTKNGSSAGTLVDITNQSGGTVTFQSGTLSSTSSAGTGLNLSNADGTVNFSGTATLNGGDAGIDITTGSSGTFTFGNQVSVTNPSGDAFNLNGSAPTVTMLGSISKASAGRAVNITGQSGGTVTFGSGSVAGGATPTLTATAGSGILLSNADGTVNFTGNTTLNGGTAGIDVEAGSGGTILFADTTSVTGATAAEPALSVLSSAPNLTYRGQLTHNTGRVLTVDGLSGGTVTLTGAVTSGTSAAPAGLGALIQSSSGGSVTFSGSSKSFYTAANPAVTLANSTGSGPTVSFSNGGLSITTTSGAGLNATSGGTLTVTGTTNTISSTTGTALNVVNTTIGTGGLNFQRIDANGGTYGINLNNTGSTAGLTVSGSGSAGSGGTIQNTSVDGVYLNSGRNMSLSWMTFTNANSVDGGGPGVCDGSTNASCNAPVKLANLTNVNLDHLSVTGSKEVGINGQNIRNLTISNTTVTNVGDAVHEMGINLFELFGTNTISNTSVSGSANHGLFVRVNSATTAAPGTPDSLLISGSSFTNPGSQTVPSDGVTISARNTANFRTTVQNSTFTQATPTHGTDGIQVDAGDSSVSDVSITGSTFSGWNQSAINLSGALTSRTTFNVTNNPTVSGGVGMGINVFSGNDADLRGTIANNTITTPVGNNNGYGVALAVEDIGRIVADLNGNTVTNYAFGLGGYTRATGVGELDATIRNNTVTAGGSGSFAGLYVENANGTLQNNRVCLNLLNNDISKGINPVTYVDYALGSYSGSTFQLQGYVGASNNSATVTSFLSGRDINGADADVTIGGTVNYVNATCATP